MYQLLAVLIAFAIIPILIRKGVKLSYTLLATAGVLGILSNIGIGSVIDSILNVFVNSASRTTVLTILMVSILGGLMGHYKVLDKIVKILEVLISNKKNIMMIIPAFIGLLVIPGGALLSAPFMDDLGKQLKLSPGRRAAINLVFRHIAMFIVPYSTGILIILSSFPRLSIARIIALNMVFIGIMIFIGYHLYIKDIEIDIVSKRVDLAKNIAKLLLVTSPIYIPVIINMATGLPFYLTLGFSIVIVYFLSDKVDFMKSLFKSIDWHTILTVVAILIVKEIILQMDGLLGIFTAMFENNTSIFSTLAIFFITSLFFGFITGNQGASLAITLPMIAQLDVSTNMLYNYIYFAFTSAFIGYFFSPVHL